MEAIDQHQPHTPYQHRFCMYVRILYTTVQNIIIFSLFFISLLNKPTNYVRLEKAIITTAFFFIDRNNTYNQLLLLFYTTTSFFIIMDTSRQMGITMTGKVTGFLSMMGAGWIIYEVLHSKKKKKKPYFRLLLGMMFIEFSDGLSFFLGSWCVPAGTWWGAVGNRQTCIFQGFLLQLSIGSALYNAGLSLYYLLSIRYNWTERLFQKKVEPAIHIISLGFAISTAIASYFLDIYGSIGDVCYFSRYPYGCKETYLHGYTTCEQGDNTTLYLILFFQFPLWFCVAFTAMCMILVWLSVRNQETRNARYAFAGNDESRPNRKHSRQFAKQGFLYVAVFYLGHIFSSSNLIRMLATGQISYPLYVLALFFLPLEGFLNCLVYLRPRFLKRWKKYKKQKQREKNNSKQSKTSSGATTDGEGPQDQSDSKNEKHTNDMEEPSNDSIQNNNNNNDNTPAPFTSGEEGEDEESRRKRMQSIKLIKLEEAEDLELDAY